MQDQEVLTPAQDAAAIPSTDATTLLVEAHTLFQRLDVLNSALSLVCSGAEDSEDEFKDVVQALIAPELAKLDIGGLEWSDRYERVLGGRGT